MSLRERLFKPDWQHSDAERRARAVRESNDPDLLAALPRLARDDPDAVVRLAALRRVDDPTAIEHCRRRDTDQAVRQHAEKQTVDLLVRSEDCEHTKLARQVLEAQPPLASASIERMAIQANLPEVRELALAQIERAGCLGDRVLADPDRGIRERTLQRITQRSTLERVGKQLRRRDKALFQAAQQRLAELDPKRRKAAGRDDARVLCEHAEALARGETVRDLGAQLHDLESRWQAVEHPDPILQQRFEGACRILHHALARDTSSEPAAADPAPEPSASDDCETAKHEPDGNNETRTDSDTADPGLAALAAELSATGASNPDNVQDWLQRWQRAWSALQQPGPADQALRQAVEARARQALETGTGERRAHAERAEQFAHLLDEFGTALDNGHLVEANRIAQRLHKLDVNKLPAARRREWQQKLDRLNELRGWQRWSDNQVRTRLIEDLEALLADEPTADAITARVREARAAWNDLQRQEAEHGMRPLQDDHSLVRRFNGVCGRAMRQARPFLKKRRQVQEERLHAIESLLGDIDDALQRDVDTRELLRLRRTAANALRQVGDLPAPARKSTANALRQRLDLIGRAVDERAEQIDKLKRRLIREAEQLAHVDDHAEAIRQAKQLQRKWQQAGTARRSRERELWAAFRRPIDPLFEQQDQRRQQEREARRNQRAEQEKLCAELQEIAAQETAQLADRAARVEALREQWSGQSNLGTKLKQRFEQALRQYDQRRREHEQAVERARRKREQDNARRHQAWAEAVLAGEQPPQLPDDAPQLPREPGELRRLLEENSAAARQLCIQAEFLAGIASPAEDREARMAYQVERLAGHLGGGHSSDAAAELDELQRRWLEVYPLLPAAEPELRKRFETALDMALKNV